MITTVSRNGTWQKWPEVGIRVAENGSVDRGGSISVHAGTWSRIMVKNCKLETARLRHPGFKIRGRDFKTPKFTESPENRCMTFADCRLQTADCRPQIVDCKLKDTKNLPNKGDTMKNITWCESEKVAKLASFPRCCWLFFTDATLYWLIRHITNCADSLFFFDYCELIMTSSNAH